MNESYLNLTSNNISIIEAIQIKNQYAIYSTIDNDPIFQNKYLSKPIFCAGKIKSFTQNVYNLRKNDSVGYISLIHNSSIELSSNLVLKVKSKENKLLISILPYASYAMKIIRIINPRIGNKYFILGVNFFTILLKKLIDLSGASVILKDVDQLSKERILLEDLNENDLILILNQKLINYELLSNINSNKIININQISPFDNGIEDTNYISGIKYPYSYVRWHFQENLRYFLNIIEKKILNLEFSKYIYIELNSFNELNNQINQLKNKALHLFKIKD